MSTITSFKQTTLSNTPTWRPFRISFTSTTYSVSTRASPTITLMFAYSNRASTTRRYRTFTKNMCLDFIDFVKYYPSPFFMLRFLISFFNLTLKLLFLRRLEILVLIVCAFFRELRASFFGHQSPRKETHSSVQKGPLSYFVMQMAELKSLGKLSGFALCGAFPFVFSGFHHYKISLFTLPWAY